MLNVSDLQTAIKNALTDIYKPAVKNAVLGLFDEKSDYAESIADTIATTFDETTSDQFAQLLANAIDYYVKNITITGMFITTGSPWTHIGTIVPAGKPIMAGKVPNTLGIS